ncbi:DUF4453 domain-containing protein [Phaeobacter italicus]|uniref:DUF4453 domain-containing protein n=1 Tax=Phaeobacter italicus TaxID=481446 RepID=UPI00248F29D7|nr:DUF4453 domain-containing protein [Phaeobacter italicus]
MTKSLLMSFFLTTVTLPVGAFAGETCEDLWFTRNLIMDRAGYCFGSALGQSLFDNGDCLGKSVVLDAASTRLVQELRAREAQFACKVDTSRRSLSLEDGHLRQLLIDLPIADDLESACLGWLGNPVPLYSARSANSARIGYIQADDIIRYAHDSIGNWSYVTVHSPGWQLKTGGWYDHDADPEACAQFAG